MPPVTPAAIPDRHAGVRVREAHWALLTLVFLCLVSVFVWLLCIFLIGFPLPGDRLTFPAGFGVSSLLLLAGSVAMNRSVSFVKRERQAEFRRWLKIAAGLAALFMGVQSYALLGLLPATRSSAATSLGVRPFVMVLTGLHAMHFFVATLFVSVILARSIADRYDHEYHWGVTMCAWFWHLLGIAWMAILAVFAIAFGQ